MKEQTSKSWGPLGFVRTLAFVAVAVAAWHPRASAQQHKPPVTSGSTQPSQSTASAPPVVSLPITGNGTANTIPVFTRTYTIGNSLLTQSGNTVNVTGSVSARSFAGDGSGLTNVNANVLNGLSASAFAQTSAANTFTADQTINGNLNFTGAANSALILQGNVFDANGEESANVIGGFPGNIVDPGVIGATIAGGGGNFNGPRPPSSGKRQAPNTRTNSARNAKERDANNTPGIVFQPNHAAGNAASIGGGFNNFTLAGATVGGGANNYAGFYGTVAGGNTNKAGGEYSTVAGGQDNSALADWSTIGGGFDNLTTCDSSNPNCTTNGGGAGTVAGGANNSAVGPFNTVGGGFGNSASGAVAGGSTVAGGVSNLASGDNATVPGGVSNTAAGYGSFAAGNGATANFGGSFVWSDGVSLPGTVQDTGTQQFVAEAIGGFFFFTDKSGEGATLASGSGSWSSLSDRNAKTNFTPIDSSVLLEKLAAMPISTWNYRAQADSVHHLGPTAQDFQAAFGLGEDDKHISTVDAEGVALASVQALYRTVSELKSELEKKEHELDELNARLARLEQSAGKH